MPAPMPSHVSRVEENEDSIRREISALRKEVGPLGQAIEAQLQCLSIREEWNTLRLMRHFAIRLALYSLKQTAERKQ